MIRSQMQTAVKKFNAAIAEGDVESAKTLLREASSKIDNAATKNVIHKNAANRKKSQIAKALSQLERGVVVVKVDAKTLKQAEQKAAAQRKAEEAAAIKAQRNEAKKAKEAAKAPASKKSAKKTTSSKSTKTAESTPKTAKESALATEEAPKKRTRKAAAPKAPADTSAPATPAESEEVEDEIK